MDNITTEQVQALIAEVWDGAKSRIEKVEKKVKELDDITAIAQETAEYANRAADHAQATADVARGEASVAQATAEEAGAK